MLYKKAQLSQGRRATAYTLYTVPIAVGLHVLTFDVIQDR